ncbi:M48 family metallopeptidase [Pyrinomonas methylaliphatogenes]|nr:M48 family metallopeptidase [Pyrinomonas methylaliphatogenes]
MRSRDRSISQSSWRAARCHRGRVRSGDLTVWLAIWLIVAMAVMPQLALAQTRISAPKNSYSPRDDVRLGQEAAREVERQLPLLNDEVVQDYIERVGQRLVAAIPAQFQHPEFHYTFKVVNVRDINAFALPGGPLYVNRGVIEVAHNEGELAGVMAHEISHIALRHGTAQATKAQKFQLPAIGGAILGAIIGGGLGQVIAQGTQTGLGIYFLKYSREYETQADVLGAQIMARAGYDPRDLANMFRTLEREGGSGGPEWLSDHPNPGNRYERIEREAQMLRVSNPIRDTAEFERIKERLRSMGRAPSMQEVQSGGRRYPQGGGPRGRVEMPSRSYRTYTGNLFRVSVPDNWRELAGGSSTIFAPDGAYGEVQGQFVFTHGVQIGIARAQAAELRRATDNFINTLIQGNSYLRQQGGYQRAYLSGREALRARLAGESYITGRTEIVEVYTTLLRGGDLFYVITVAPQSDYSGFQSAFNTVLRSIQLND